MEVSILVPVKNEENNIVKVIQTLQEKVNILFEILIIYDSEQDLTKETANRYIKKHKIKNVYLIKNIYGDKKGVINAIKTGLKYAKGNAVVITMADLSDDMGQINEMNNLIKQGYDVVAASRYMPGGKKIGGPFLKTLLSKVAGLSLYRFFKLPTRDATNAFKMYRRSIFKNILIDSTGGFEYSLEITLKAFKMGYKITEIPTEWHDEPQGGSHFKLLEWLPKYIKTYLLIFKNEE